MTGNPLDRIFFGRTIVAIERLEALEAVARAARDALDNDDLRITTEGKALAAAVARVEGGRKEN